MTDARVTSPGPASPTRRATGAAAVRTRPPGRTDRPGVVGRVGRGAAGATAVGGAGSTRLSAADPRWVLALRAGEAMQGPMLTMDRRQRLIRTGRMLGLTPFEANLVLAIVQDQARRGGDVADAAGALACVPLHQRRPRRDRRRWRMLGWIVLVVALEAATLVWLF